MYAQVLPWLYCTTLVVQYYSRQKRVHIFTDTPNNLFYYMCSQKHYLVFILFFSTQPNITFNYRNIQTFRLALKVNRKFILVSKTYIARRDSQVRLSAIHQPYYPQCIASLRFGNYRYFPERHRYLYSVVLGIFR